MDFGVHLPIVTLTQEEHSLDRLRNIAQQAEILGYSSIAVTDHLLYTRPFLDSLSSLSAIISSTTKVALMTSVALLVVRGPVPLAKSLTAIDILSEGRLIAGVSTGSNLQDYAAVGIPFDERWKRFSEAVQVLRLLWQPQSVPFTGQYYSTVGIDPLPYPKQHPMPPIWIGSWGSDAGLRRTALLGDGWIASAYNTNPADFASGYQRLRKYLRDAGRNPDGFPNAISTMFFYISDDSSTIDSLIYNVLSPMFNRSGSELRQRFLIGSAQQCVAQLSAYKAAGAQRILLWPVYDELEQLTIFQESVAPFVEGSGDSK